MFIILKKSSIVYSKLSLLTVPSLVEKTVSNIQEVVTRGAKTLVVTNQDLGDKVFDKVIRIPEISEYLS